MKKLIIIGAGDFGREAAYIVRRINLVSPEYELIGFVDDGEEYQGKTVDGYPVLGRSSYLQTINEKTYIVCSINNGRVKQRLVAKALENPALELANVIDPSAVIADDAHLGKGIIIQPFVFVAVNATLCNNVVLNHSAGVGHDDVIGECTTISPGVTVGGHTSTGECCYLGAGCHILQGLSICEDVTIGASASVIRDITEPGTYVGVPVRKVK